MASQLSAFHYVASTVPARFDFEREDFDISQIYQYYSLKVSLSKFLTISFRSTNALQYHSSWTKCSRRNWPRLQKTNKTMNSCTCALRPFQTWHHKVSRVNEQELKIRIQRYGFRASLESEFDHSAPLYLKNVTNS